MFLRIKGSFSPWKLVLKYFEHKYKISFHSEVAKFYGNILENLTTLIIKVLKKTNDVIYENKKKYS